MAEGFGFGFGFGFTVCLINAVHYGDTLGRFYEHVSHIVG